MIYDYVNPIKIFLTLLDVGQISDVGDSNWIQILIYSRD